MQQTTTRKTSRWYYAIGVAVIVLGISGSVIFMATRGGVVTSHTTRIVVPGIHEIQLDAPGKYTVFYEYNSVVDGHFFATKESIPEITASLTAADSSQLVELSKPSTTQSYRNIGLCGRSVLVFRIDEPGTFVFAAAYSQGKTGQDVVYAIGQTSNPMLIGITAFALGFGGVIIGGVIILVTFVRRLNAARTAKTASASEAVQTPPRHPSRWYYVMGAAVIVLGLVGTSIYNATQSRNVARDTRVIVPGSQEVQLGSTGKYTIFHEYRSTINGHTYSTKESVPGILVEVTAKDTSRPVDLASPSMSSPYETSVYAGTPVLEFNIDEAGTYTFAADYGQGRSGPDVVLTIAKNNEKRVFITGMVTSYGSLVIGILIIVITLTRRRIATNRMKGVSVPDAGSP